MNHHHPYRPQISQIPADLIRVDTHDPRRSTNPHPGICPAPRTVPCYWDASPNGERHHPAAIVHCSLYIVHWSCFDSRYYSSDLSIWLSVDPMSGKYPSLSPYVYCADNPVRVVDPNGEDYVVVVEGNTITIKAMYFVTIDTQKGVDEAIRNFKEQAPNLSYTSQDGKTYSVKFDLSIAKVFDTPEQAKQAKEENKGCGCANYCVSGEMYRAGFSETQSLSTSFNFSTDDMWKYVGKGKVIIKTKKR